MLMAEIPRPITRVPVVKSVVNNGINLPTSTGAGFQPSTVWQAKKTKELYSKWFPCPIPPTPDPPFHAEIPAPKKRFAAQNMPLCHIGNIVSKKGGVIDIFVHLSTQFESLFYMWILHGFFRGSNICLSCFSCSSLLMSYRVIEF